MIVEIVTIPLAEGMRRQDAIELYRTTAGKWAENPDLIHKYYHFDEARCLGGGVYIWPSREAAARWHGEDYKAMVLRVYGSHPHFEIFDLLMDVDPAKGSVIEVRDRGCSGWP